MIRLIKAITVLLLLFALALLVLGCGHVQYFKPHPRPWTKGEKIAGGFFLAAHALNAYSTERHQDYPDQFYERNIILGKHPNDREIVGYFAISGLLALGIAHWWPELRYPLLGGYGITNAYYAYDDFKLIRKKR